MLLLLGSLPLSGVFAEATNTEESAFVPETNIVENEQVEENGAVGSVVSEKTENIENEPINESETIITEGTLEEEIQSVESIYTQEAEVKEGIIIEAPELAQSVQVEKIERAELVLEEEMQPEETTPQEKLQIQLQASIEKEGHFSYREDYGKSVLLSFFVEEWEGDTELYVTAVSTNEAVIKPVKQQEEYSLSEGLIAYTITGVGGAELILELSENELCEAKELRISVEVADSSIKDEDFVISYVPYNTLDTILFTSFTEWKQFLEQHHYWLSGTIRLGISQIGESFYEEIHIKKENVEGVYHQKQHEIAEEALMQTYEFWLSNFQTHTSTENVENGKRTFQLGIDRTAPQNTTFSYSENAYEATSTDITKYYSDNVVLSGVFEDSLSGVERIEYTMQADLGEAAKWEMIHDVEIQGTKASFEQILGEGMYTGVGIRAIDKAGNISETIELRNEMGDFLQIIVDNREPILDVVLKTRDENSYQGEWTNQGITITVQEDIASLTIAGIQCIQYQYVSIGEEYRPEQWREIPLENEIKIGYEENIKENQNGIYYFRAISNTGVITDIETQKKTAARIRLQQSLPEKQGKKEVAPALKEEQEWYNKKTGVPMISFSYPPYDIGIESLEYGAPIMVHTRLTRKQGENKGEEENTAEILEQSVTIGMHSDEQYQQFMHIENNDIEQNIEEYIRKNIQQNIEILDIDFSYDSKTGYAKDGIYELEYWISDKAGNESQHDIYIYKIDTHEPERLKVFVDGTSMQEDTSQTIQYDRFYQSAVSGSVSADFGVSGKRSIKLMLTEETEISANSNGWQESDEFVINPCKRGCIYVLAEDIAGNQAILKTQGVVVDNQAPKGEYGGKFIQLITKANDNHFYNNNISFSLSAGDMPQEDVFSGIESFSYVVSTTEKESSKEIFSFTKVLPSKEELIVAKSYAITEILNAADFEGNHAYIEITVKDRCGNVATDREEIKIDITAPQVEIDFDLNEPRNGSYYQQARTATIQIEELNFDGNSVEIEVTKDGTVYPVSISEWHSEGVRHWANIVFFEDGDYTMNVICTDLADNISEEVTIEPFTVDVTKPIVEITYDNQDVRNEWYYQKSQTATIVVKEHNFSEADFTLSIEPQVTVGEWSHMGDEHSLQLYFIEDSHYRFLYRVLDLAGNEAEAVEEEVFVIDSIAPQIVIQGVEDDSANAGEIHPIVMVYDANPNVQGAEIAVTTGLGEPVAVSTQVQELESGYSYQLIDMSQQEDNVYLLEITALDMAGNCSTLNYRFSLNRHGSTYDLSQLATYTERVYNRFEQLMDFCVTEMNVDKIEEYAFYVSRNGKMLDCMEITEQQQKMSLGENVYYYVEKKGDDRKGYTNHYRFPKENFEKEGIYRITCYSKDRAGNESNNTLEEKKAEISFVIDNTPPKVVVNGIKEGGIYNEEARKVNIMVQDNFLLKQAVFSLVTESGEILESWDYMEFVQNAGDTMTITIPSREEKQFLVYQVSDVAGNELVLLPDTEKAPKGFLITTDTWLRFISSPIKVMVSVIGCIGVIATGLLYIKKKDVESQVL